MSPLSRLADWLLLLLGPLLALVLTNVAFERWGWSLLAQDAGLPHTVQATLRTASGADIIVLGSSAGVFSVDGARLSEQTGRSAINASRHGASPLATAMILPDVLRLEPDVVVHVLSPLGLRADQGPDWDRMYTPAVAWELLGPAAVRAQPAAHREGMLGWLSVLYRHREGLRRALAERLGLKSARFELGQGGAAEGMQAEFAAAQFDGTGPNIAALSMIAQRVAASGGRYVVCLAPIRSDITGAFYPAQPAVLFESLPQEHIPVAMLGQYRDELFMDPVHLNEPGAAQFTDRLADWLAD